MQISRLRKVRGGFQIQHVAFAETVELIELGYLKSELIVIHHHGLRVAPSAAPVEVPSAP